MNNQKSLKDLNRSIPDNYLSELAKVSNPEKAKELARVFFTYQHIYDQDANHQTKLADCSIPSIMTCLIQCAMMNLWPDSVNQYVYFVPYAGKCTLAISYKGLMKIMCEYPSVKLIYADVVREGEDCDTETLKHTRTFKTLNNHIIGAYAVVKFTNGEQLKALLGKEDLVKIKGCAKTKKVWEKWENEMCKKAAIRRLAKMVLPQLRVKEEEKKHLKAALDVENKEYDLGRTIEPEEQAGTPEELESILEGGMVE